MKNKNPNPISLNPSLTRGTSKQQGFTLIELIVSVTIIAILTVVGMVSFSGTNKKARDSRRMADLENIRMALELYRQGTGSSYPDIDDTGAPLVDKYIKELPKDPKEKTSYEYGHDGYTYYVCAKVEDVGSTSEDQNSCPALSGDGTYVGYYKVTNP